MARHSRTARTRSRTRNHGGSLGPRVLPWVLLGQATVILRDRPLDLEQSDRVRLRQLIGKAGGRGINLSLRERSELARLVNRANTPALRPVPAPLVGSRRHANRRAR